MITVKLTEKEIAAMIMMLEVQIGQQETKLQDRKPDYTASRLQSVLEAGKSGQKELMKAFMRNRDTP